MWAFILTFALGWMFHKQYTFNALHKARAGAHIDAGRVPGRGARREYRQGVDCMFEAANAALSIKGDL
ncbi:MAG TPA: hypothetical protein VHO25_22310 [Polyangiaceae bacterium]|nr:hypothetical protein [Polyangiaceae bacterium]